MATLNTSLLKVEVLRSTYSGKDWSTVLMLRAVINVPTVVISAFYGFFAGTCASKNKINRLMRAGY